MKTTDWTKVQDYLNECNTFAEDQMSDPSDIPAMDENITKGMHGLREVFGLDLEDEKVAFALVVGFLVSYQYGCQSAMNNSVFDPVGAQMYLTKHGRISGHIGLVARQIATNLGITFEPEAG